MSTVKKQLPDDISYKFIYSCSLELVCSLHVLTDPSHHINCKDWYSSALMSLDKGLLHRIVAFGQTYGCWDLVMDLIDDFSKPPQISQKFEDDFPSVIKRLHDIPREEFTYIFLGETIFTDRENIPSILKDPESISNYDLSNLFEYISKEDIIYFLNNVDEVKNEMIDIMQLYYESFFKTYWVKVCAFYKGVLIHEVKNFDPSNALSFILSMHDNLSFTSNNLIIKKKMSFSVDAKDIKHINIIFSAFTYPHLMINIYNNQITIYKNLLMPNMNSSFEDLAFKAKIFSDPTRLTIIKFLLHNELTNKYLSSLLNITPASVSQHLKILKDANMLLSYRKQNTIYYKINVDQMKQALAEFQVFIDL